ncbi:MAG: InlB B-repeat-containing protein [Oscillospiraceae bacterium]|nr:InlB B-repeat-containing protein [Oscillospiraceae bacterium]
MLSAAQTGKHVTDSIKIQKGDTFQLGIKIYPEDATNKAVTWSSRDTSVATVSSSGLVTAKGIGNTVIVAETKDGGYKITCDVEVTENTCLVHFDVGGGYISTPYMEVPEGTYITLPEEIPVCPGNVFTGWQTTDSAEGEWTKTKPSSGSYETGYKYYIWGYEHNSDYTFVYGKNKDELISHVKSESKTFGSYNPSKMRYLYLIESSDKGSSFYPGKNGSNYNYFNADYIAEDGKTGTANIYKTEFYFESNVYKQDAAVAVIYQPGDSFLVTKDTVFTALWENEPPTIVLDSFECTPNCTTGFSVYIENNDATENLSFDFDFVYDKTAFEIESIETFFPEDGVVSVNGDNVKYEVVNGETGAFSGVFATVVLKIKDAEIKDYVFTIKVNKWVNGFGSVEPKIVDGIITINHSACVVHYYSPVECALPEDEVYEYGDEIIISNAPEDEDWEFIYWSDDNGIKYYPGEKVKLVDSYFYLQANWKPKWTPVITVENASGAPGETVAIPVNITNNLHSENTSIYVLVDTGNAIYKDFEGVQGLPVNGNIGTIYVKIPETAKNGDSYTISAVPTTFSVFEENGVIEIFEYVQTKTGVLIVKEPEEEYTVTFDPGKGTGGPKDMIVSGDEFTVPTEIPVRENWNFLFWMAQDGKSYHPEKTYTITENLDLVAIFEPGWMPEISVENVKGKPGEKVELRVTIANNKENPEKRSIIIGIEPYRDEREDHVFSYTVTELPQNGMIGKISFTIPEDAEPGMVYKATVDSDMWVVGGFDMASSEMLKYTNGSITVEEPEKATYTVTYDANGGTGAPSAQTKTEGETLKLSSTEPVRDGYEFLGWATSKAATSAQYQPGDSYTKDENVTLYAVWKQKEVIPEDAPTIMIGEVSGRAGETIEVSVVLKNNPGIASIKLSIDYDSDVLEVVSATISDAYKGIQGATVVENTAKKPILLNWAFMSISGTNVNDEKFATITFKIKDSAEVENTTVSVSYKSGDIFNAALDNVNFHTENGEIKIVKYIPGDINGDGNVNNKDVMTLFYYLSGLDYYVVEAATDINGDGNVNNKDVMTLFYYLSGLDYEIH